MDLGIFILKTGLKNRKCRKHWVPRNVSEIGNEGIMPDDSRIDEEEGLFWKE